MLVLQAYIKTSICRRNKMKVFNAVQKIVGLMKRYPLRKNMQKYAIVNMTRRMVLDLAWQKVTQIEGRVIATYFRGLLTQVGERTKIGAANYNTRRKFQERFGKGIVRYVKGFS